MTESSPAGVVVQRYHRFATLDNDTNSSLMIDVMAQEQQPYLTQFPS